MKVIRIIRETQTFITIIFPYLHIIIITKYPYIGQTKYKIKKKELHFTNHIRYNFINNQNLIFLLRKKERKKTRGIKKPFSFVETMAHTCPTRDRRWSPVEKKNGRWKVSREQEESIEKGYRANKASLRYVARCRVIGVIGRATFTNAPFYNGRVTLGSRVTLLVPPRFHALHCIRVKMEKIPGNFPNIRVAIVEIAMPRDKPCRVARVI